MACISPNPRRVGYIDLIHGALYMCSHIHQHTGHILEDNLLVSEVPLLFSTFRRVGQNQSYVMYLLHMCR